MTFPTWGRRGQGSHRRTTREAAATGGDQGGAEATAASRLRAWFDVFHRSGPDQIALSAAVRGTISVGGPLVGLQLMGHPAAALFAGIGALNASIADAGGPYRQRLTAMGLCALIMPFLLFAGMQSHHGWLVATTMIVAVAVLGAMARALGQTGTSLGLIAGLVFLVGAEVPAPPREAVMLAGFYAGGAIWTLFVAMALWRLRPYKRLELEVAACFGQVERLLEQVRSLASLESAESRWRHRQIERQHRALRDAIETARTTLGATRATVDGLSPTIGRLLVLLRVASRVAAAGLGFADALDSTHGIDRMAVPTRHAVAALLGEAGTACARLAGILVSGKGQFSHEAVERAVRRLESDFAATSGNEALAEEPDAVRGPSRLFLRQLEDAEEAVGALFGAEHGLTGLILPPLHALPAKPKPGVIKAHFTPDSIIFRYAMRLGAAMGIGAVIFTATPIPHGMWVPLTTLIVLQPDFGGTLRRALLRTGGTVGGVLVAGCLVLLLHGSHAIDIGIIVLTFATFLLFRRSYGLAVTFLTPLIVLLLDRLEPAHWTIVEFRLVNTVLGAVLALACGYLLWPVWERRRLPQQLAVTLEANRKYLGEALSLASDNAPPMDSLVESRRRSEVEVGNAEASFQRMLSEPRWRRENTGRYLAMVTYLRRLTRHVTAFAALSEYAGERRRIPGNMAPLIDGALAALAQYLAALEDHNPSRPRSGPKNASPFETLDLRIPPASGGAIDASLDAVLSDVNALLEAGRRL